LRECDDHRAAERQCLRQREGRIACPRGKIDDKIVELTPFHVAQELAEAGAAYAGAGDVQKRRRSREQGEVERPEDDAPPEGAS